ncbi:cytochrome c oxidase cbb3-type subunit 3 [Trichlorobacter thiogenes]|uniref:Cytochrome c oxidase cbb3-type subunit 3 n=1 Tax=Trichlorobacter thiogenes TaxID=115783 RepID=A0A1T4QZ79_9BACT|nr:cytochrome c [Trichlorobacter thiogenes]SKA09050.1 cytochrome c oxidase cbb3-type subunit 3 [Trichlorobacter thiogenes]
MRPTWLLAGILLLVAGCSQQSREPATARQTPITAVTLFAELCAACHGSQARGGVGPDLSASRYKYGKNRSAIIKSILDGRAGGMPAFGSHLKPEEAAVLAEYLLSL